MGYKADLFLGRSSELPKLENVSGDWMGGQMQTVCGRCCMPRRIVECRCARTQEDVKDFIKRPGHDSIQRTFTGADFALSRQMKL